MVTLFKYATLAGHCAQLIDYINEKAPHDEVVTIVSDVTSEQEAAAAAAQSASNKKGAHKKRA